MKHSPTSIVRLALCFLLLCACSLPAAQATGKAPLEITLKRVPGPTYDQDGSMVEYPYLEANDPAFSFIAEKINTQIAEEARIPEYTQLLSTLRLSGTGLIMQSEIVQSQGAHNGEGYLSCLITAQGKMLSGPPSFVSYPLVFDLSTGDRVTFEQVFDDPEGAKQRIEQFLTDEIEPQLSTYLENNELLPVPWEQFAFSRNGLVTFYYPARQFSFLSGSAGAVSFRYSELWDFLDLSPEGISMQLVSDGNGTHQYGWMVGQDVDTAAIFERESSSTIPGLDPLLAICGDVEAARKNYYTFTSDSSYYPGGACLELEDPRLRGTWMLTDPSETTITGYLTSRVDAYGVMTGKTSLNEAVRLLGSPAGQLPLDENTARQYLVCPGQALIYTYQKESGHFLYSARCTLYFDQTDTLQYIKLEAERKER